ncbi:hypothetical protein HD554DRAFT_846467 [Boletus coccyginus]|nr:hypothetical protein HD554DRAFT_846467 [Boletus coccyginus]
MDVLPAAPCERMFRQAMMPSLFVKMGFTSAFIAKLVTRQRHDGAHTACNAPVYCYQSLGGIAGPNALDNGVLPRQKVQLSEFTLLKSTGGHGHTVVFSSHENILPTRREYDKASAPPGPTTGCHVSGSACGRVPVCGVLRRSLSTRQTHRYIWIVRSHRALM